MNSLSKWRISLYLAAVFAAGAVTGGFTAFKVMRHKMQPPHQHEMVARWCGELESKLALTPEQVHRIKPIIEESMGEFKNVLSTQILSSLSNSNQRISRELTPEQQSKFVEIEREQREFIRKRFGDEIKQPAENLR